ncbi:MFS transporter [Azohydromonas sediminis]|uniref:MFS transporter n=1 Tax=Azohydromonas sediminis TaxID=2259674 RepID=UPI000E65B7CD|nr:MFS transporter [Azohydromonas sediminis]
MTTPSDAPPPQADAAPRVTAWSPLALPVFRMLWLVWVTANACMWMNDVAAAWLMTQLAGTPGWVALVQTASTLPVFLLGLASGALADIVDRRRYLMVTQVWVAAVATLVCLVLLAGAMTPPLLLALTFLNGIGLAMRWPVFAALVPEVVPKAQLSPALALNGIAMNASRIIGPVAAGAIIAGAGTVWVFVLNAVLSVGAALAIWRWKREVQAKALPAERFVGAIRVGLQYVRQSQRMHVVLLRVALFFMQSTALLALLPLVAQGLEGGGAGSFTLLLACMGAGAVLAAAQMQALRRRLSYDQMLRWGSLLQVAAMSTVALAPTVWIAAPGMLVAGMAWISVANSLTLSAQFALPDWVRARGMSIYQMALMGGAAVGAALWGQVAHWTSLRSALLLSAATGLAIVLATRRLSIEAREGEDLTPAPLAPPPLAGPRDPHEGPVLVSIEYLIDPADEAAFRSVMRDTRRARLRQGVLSWWLFRDAAQPGRYVEYFVDESWVEHLRRFDRMTAADLALRERRNALHRGPTPPVVTRCLAEAVDAD